MSTTVHSGSPDREPDMGDLSSSAAGQSVKADIGKRQIPVVVIAGDGIGPEVTAATITVLEHALRSSQDRNVSFLWEPVLAGKQALEAYGEALPNETIEKLRACSAALKGPLATEVGSGFRSVNVALRKILDLYANIRPVRPFEGLENPSKTAENLNVVIFRENTEDVYAGIEYESGSVDAQQLIELLKLEERGVPLDAAIGLKVISESATRRLVRKAVEYTLANDCNRITLVHKGNIMKFTEGAFVRWGYDEAQRVLGDRFLPWEDFNNGARVIPDGRILVQDRIADAMFQDLILVPQNHQVIATMNLNGDYLSDAAAALVGGLGLAPGMNQGDGFALAEAVHGTAPDIAGKGIANPTALILSGVMLLRSLNLRSSADLIDAALCENFRRGDLTGDLAKRHARPSVLGTQAFTERLCQRIDELA